jgi:DNA topoisomerase-2
MRQAEREGLEVKFKLTTSVATSNLVVHDLNGRIRKYNDVSEIIKDFFDLRQTYYHKRKDYILNELTAEHMKIENKVRFVTEIVSGKLIVHSRKKAELMLELKARGYDPISKSNSSGVIVAGGLQESDNDEASSMSTVSTATNPGASSSQGYDYLLSMPIWNLTMEKVY